MFNELLRIQQLSFPEILLILLLGFLSIEAIYGGLALITRQYFKL